VHGDRFGRVLGEEPLMAAALAPLEYDEETVRLYGKELYWEDYRERNAPD
jgi:hypothetical protein